MHAGGGSANLTFFAFPYCFAMLDFSLPGGGSAKCFKNLLKHLLFCNRCYAIVVLQLCFAIDVLQLSFCICRFAILVS